MKTPDTGFVVEKENVKPFLTEFTSKLGLVGREQREFIEYWEPRLTKEVKTPYIFISIYDKEEKEIVDHVVITPEPTTRIEFLAYFKPIAKPYAVEPLDYPVVPERKGFVEVEWGGAIDW